MSELDDSKPDRSWNESIDARVVASRAGVGTAQVAIRGHPPGPAANYMRYARHNINRIGALVAGGHIGAVELPWPRRKGEI